MHYFIFLNYIIKTAISLFSFANMSCFLHTKMAPNQLISGLGFICKHIVTLKESANDAKTKDTFASYRI